MNRVTTDQNRVMYEDPEWVASLVDRIPVRRPGQPSHLEGPIVFLASDASEYITGQALLVDGGISVGAVRALPSPSGRGLRSARTATIGKPAFRMRTMPI